MAYDDTHCVCRGRKPTHTLLCDECDRYLATHPDRHPDHAALRDPTTAVEYRRAAAIRLLAAARTRPKASPHPVHVL
jgi:hypothetical protein